MAKEIKEIVKPKPVKKQEKKGLRQVDIGSEVSARERDQLRSMTSDMRKITLRYKKIIGVFITMDIKGKFQIVHFGAGPQISKRSQYLADNIAKSIKPLIDAYDIPQRVDLPAEKVRS